MNNFYPLENREPIHTSPMPDGGSSAFYRTSFGFETDIYTPDGFLVSRGSLGSDLAPLQSTTQPSLVHWNKQGQVILMSFSPNANQVESYFKKTSTPLTISYGLIGGQLLPTNYYGIDPVTGEINQTFVSFYATGVVSAVTTYDPHGKARLTRYNEDGSQMDEHFFVNGTEVFYPENARS